MAGVGEHGQGTTVKLANGRYVVAVTMADGKRIWRRARTPREAERKRRALVEQRELDLDPSGQTLEAFLRGWLRGLADGRRIRRRTLEHYTMIAERHIIPALGRRRLEQLSERHVQAWLDADGGSSRTVAHHRAVLRRALNVALRQRAVVRNVAIAVELPALEKTGGAPLTLAEVRRLLEVTAGDRLGPLWRLAIDTGLRQGELLGLAWDAIAGDVISVTDQLERIPATPDAPGGWVFGPPKAARSLAAVTITPGTAAALEVHRVRMAAERTATWKYFGLVFTTSTGQPYHNAEVLKAFHLACDRAGIARRRFHDLRVTAATIMAEAGVPEEVRMARLGHSTQAMARHYALVREDLDRDAARRMEEAIGG